MEPLNSDGEAGVASSVVVNPPPVVSVHLRLTHLQTLGTFGVVSGLVVGVGASFAARCHDACADRRATLAGVY